MEMRTNAAQALRRPIRTDYQDSRVAWVKRNSALNLLGPADEDY